MSVVQRKVFVVDDEPSVLHAICRLIEAGGYECRSFGSVEECLDEVDHSVDCVVTDLMMRTKNGIELINQMSEKGLSVPIVVITGHADVPTAVSLMERGVVTVLEKPLGMGLLLDAVARATKDCDERRQRVSEHLAVRNQYGQLSADEQAVMRKMISGASNKAIACDLSISARTLDRRRRAVLDTMQVDSIAELAILAERNRLFEN